jgi:hypothetical protein
VINIHHGNIWTRGSFMACLLSRCRRVNRLGYHCALEHGTAKHHGATACRVCSILQILLLTLRTVLLIAHWLVLLRQECRSRRRRD